MRDGRGLDGSGRIVAALVACGLAASCGGPAVVGDGGRPRAEARGGIVDRGARRAEPKRAGAEGARHPEVKGSVPRGSGRIVTRGDRAGVEGRKLISPEGDPATPPGPMPRSVAGALVRGELEGVSVPEEGPQVSIAPHEAMPDLGAAAVPARTVDELRGRTLENLESASAHLRYVAAVDAGALRMPEAVDGLARLLRRTEPAAAPAIRALGAIGGDEAARALVRAYGRMDDARFDAEILQALGRTRSAAALDPLAAALRDDRVLVRVAAAHGLGNLGMPGGVRHLRRAAGDLQAPPVVRAAAAAALASLGSLEGLALLDTYVARGSPELKGMAVRGMASFVAAGAGAGADPSSERARSAAVRSIASALASPYWQAWREALLALASMKPEDATVVLDALAGASRDVAARARLARAAYGGPGAVAAIAAALVDADAHLRAAACTVAGLLGDGSAVGAVAGALADGNGSVRLAAVAALASLGGDEAAAALRRAAESQDPAQRSAARAALTSLQARGVLAPPPE